jgi:sec-independent protein translocase protein TatC
MKNPFKRDNEPATPAGEMSLLEHLTELRKRLIRSILAIVVGAIVVYIFKDQLLGFVSEPYCEFRQENASGDSGVLGSGGDPCGFLVTNPMESFSVVLTFAGYGGLMLAMPVVLYQIGRFVLPGLYPHEKKMLAPFVIVSAVLLALGMIGAYLLLPKALDVLLGFGLDSFEPYYRPSEYLGFFIKMLFAFGFAAQFPLILVFLQMIGIVDPQTLSSNRRFAIVGVVILGAIVTPTGDPFMLSVISVPMYLSYEIAIVIGKRMVKRRSIAGSTASGVAR